MTASPATSTGVLVSIVLVLSGCSGAAAPSVAPPTAAPTVRAEAPTPTPSPTPRPTASPRPTSSPSDVAPSAWPLTVLFFGDGFSMRVPADLVAGYIPGEGLERWQTTTASGRLKGIAVQTMKRLPADQRSLDGLAAAVRTQLGTQEGVTITFDDRVSVPAGTAHRIAAASDVDRTAFYLFYREDHAIGMQVINLTDEEEAALVETFEVD